MASRRPFPTFVASHRCRGTHDCTCAFCQDSAPPATAAPATGAPPAAATAVATGAAPRLPSLAEEAAALRAAVDFGAAAPDYLGREAADLAGRAIAIDNSLRSWPDAGPRSQCGFGGTVEHRTGEGVGEARGEEMATGRAGLTFATGKRGRDVPTVPSLLHLCVAEVGRYLPHLLSMDPQEFDLRQFVALLPSHARLALTAVARRRGLLSDWLLEALVDDTWHIVDLCGADVSDEGLCHVARTCPELVALDIRSCDAVSLAALTHMFKACPSLQVLRLGGSPASDRVAREAVKWMLPQQPVRGTEGAATSETGREAVGEEREEERGGSRQGEEGGEEEGFEGSWEDVEERLEERVPSLRWLVWPSPLSPSTRPTWRGYSLLSGRGVLAGGRERTRRTTMRRRGGVGRRGREERRQGRGEGW
ncbi:hypothetical protein CLOM_g21870 [Closterium sp. NIES-68]|nr:hypothetical protein CLOM_g21870 [Closterium sp. NIES-68]GJP66481.1 hypothetical protein CLOP_g23409 [Closterium sp. NIES-67]